VDLVQVDHVGLQAAQRAFAGREDVRRRQAAFARTQGMPREGPATLVASTIFCARRGARQPVAQDGLGGAEGLRARRHRIHLRRVEELMPRATARSRIAWESGSFTCSPKVMVPRQMG
jgi:hypothetical protein